MGDRCDEVDDEPTAEDLAFIASDDDLSCSEGDQEESMPAEEKPSSAPSPSDWDLIASAVECRFKKDPPSLPDVKQKFKDNNYPFIKMMSDAGVRLVTGTDCGADLYRGPVGSGGEHEAARCRSRSGGAGGEGFGDVI